MAKETELVSQFVTSLKFEDLPEIAVRYAVDAITDCAGVALIGSKEPLAQHLLKVLADKGGSDGVAYLFGSKRKAGWTEAALYNGALSHAIDYDDTSHPAHAHPSCHLVPVLLSLGKYSKAGGRALITAYVVGLEVDGRLGRALNMTHYVKGWHATSTFGAMAAAAAGAKLLGLDAQRVKWALGIAASGACGLQANFGTMTKPLHAGLAAQHGVLSALLAEKGFTAADDIFENSHGYLEVFAGAERARKEVLEQIGNPLEITTQYGLALKAFPSCGCTHTLIEAALEVAKEIKDEPVKEVFLGVNQYAPNIIVYSDPKTPLQGKFSGHFCVAAALVKKEVNRATFSEAVLNDRAVREMLGKIKMQVDERVRHNTEFGSVVKVTCVSGRTVERLVPLAKGKPERWMSREELLAKFQDCSEEVLGKEKTASAFKALQNIEKIRSVDEITDVITPA